LNGVGRDYASGESKQAQLKQVEVIINVGIIKKVRKKMKATKSIWIRIVGFISILKVFFSNRKYSLTDIIASLALMLSLYQFYFQIIKQEKEEYEKKFSTIRESAKNLTLSDVLTIKELLKEIDNEKQYSLMTDVQKETLALGYSKIRSNKRAYEISKENINTNIKQKNFDAASIFFDTYLQGALHMGEIDSLRSTFNQLDNYYVSIRNQKLRDNINANYSIAMLDYSIRNNDIQGTLNFMQKFIVVFNPQLFENSYRNILGIARPEIRANQRFIELNKQLLERYQSSEITYNSFIKTMMTEMEKTILKIGSQ
jgi:hypothetical protein